MSVTPLNSAPQVETGVGDLEALVAQLQHEVSGLREAMASRAVIEQAKGMLMLRYRVDADRAFQLLRRWSSVHNVKLRVVAAALVGGESTGLTLVSSEGVPTHLATAALGRLPEEMQPTGS